MIGRIRGYYAAHPLALDLTLIAIVTLVAGAMRLILLGELPYGVHPDEAQLATDGRKILDGELWTVYTRAVLGQPAGHAYLTLPSFVIFGWTPFAMRLPLALVGLAAVPLLYVFVRQAYGRTEAFLAALLLAFSYWHLLYSRVAHWSISYGTVTLAVLICLLRGMNTRDRRWFAAAGVFLGLGFYTYNIYPIAVVAVTVFLAITTWTTYRRGDEFRWWRGSLLVTGAVAFVVFAPMLTQILDRDSAYWWHVENYSEVGVWRTDEFKDEDVLGKMELVARQAETFFGAYAWDPSEDIVDGNGIRPMFDPATLILLVSGLVLAVRQRRNPVALAALCCFVVIPLPAVLQQGSIMRQPVAAAPFAMFIAALPLAALWRTGLSARGERRDVAALCGVAVASLVAIIAATTVRDYFWTWRNDDWPRFIYHEELRTAAEYMDGLPEGTYVLLYSWRAPINQEVYQFLAPDVEGEDRSADYSDRNRVTTIDDPSRPTAFVLMDDYLDMLPAIQAEYPGGITREIRHGGRLHLIAYEVPAAPP